FLSGTSMATPHVSGVAALLRAIAPGIPARLIKQRLLDAADPIPALQGITVSGGRLNAMRALSNPDRTPPGSIGGLEVTGRFSNSIRLAWTATGDDGDEGEATRYDIRYETDPLDETTAPHAAAAPVSGRPAPAGSPDGAEPGGLLTDTEYHFAVRAVDE